MLLDDFAPDFDATEIHRITIDAAPEVVWRELWALDLLDSAVVTVLLGLRSVPKLLAARLARAPTDRAGRVPRSLTLHDLERAGFGRLATREPEGCDEPGEVVFGVAGRFWRPTGNISPFRREAFDAPPPAGTCHAYWNFRVRETAPGRTELYTETRIQAGDSASRRKFRAYWLVVRPFSGWIRIRLLRAVGERCIASG